MHYQFLIEDLSGEILIKHVMHKFRMEYSDITYDCKPFRGIGGFKMSTKISEVKTGKLLNDLPVYLRGFDKSLQSADAVIVVVVDNDDRNVDAFRAQLESQIQQMGISIKCILGIAVEELEAWLLGDKKAVFSAYPDARESAFKAYRQDSICGTWENLANVVYKGGFARLKKDCPTYHSIGKCKAEWADRIGACMDLRQNSSPSFCRFLAALRRCAQAV